MKWLRGDRGNAAIEAGIIAPALIAFLSLVFLVGRIVLARAAVDEAARDAARQASISRTAAAARSQALNTGTTTLINNDLHCSEFSVDTGGPDLDAQFAKPIGTLAQVHVTVTCVVSYADLGYPWLPGSKKITSEFWSVIDWWRPR
ncbi:pilus assembly protein [Catenulispora sp. NL8]|uniref:Pilus assembly protein n=1 Tax=Catenulispora pinistramenti TaxID=2705254 RepID=A0ABS5KNX2_9ACTN|nr:TadE family protein [Catenulispora pinistramenti]MBS2547720.1 pilus assembly protein [Catenulispora pinistramenti]